MTSLERRLAALEGPDRGGPRYVLSVRVWLGGEVYGARAAGPGSPLVERLPGESESELVDRTAAKCTGGGLVLVFLYVRYPDADPTALACSEQAKSSRP